jgi:solute carrier family 35 protein E1
LLLSLFKLTFALLFQYNRGALVAVGGKNAGYTMTVSTMQLGVCAAYALLLWIVRINPISIIGLQLPGAQKVPGITTGDLIKTIPVGFCSAAAHSSSVFALGGDPLFGQIVKAGEPVMAAMVGFFIYGKAESIAKYMCLPIIVGGVAFASLKKNADVRTARTNPAAAWQHLSRSSAFWFECVFLFIVI